MSHATRTRAPAPSTALARALATAVATALAAAAVAAALPGRLAAQEDVPPLMRSADYRDYELSMEKVRRWARATVELDRFSEEDPSFDEAAESEEMDARLETMVALFDRYPAAAGILERERIDARDYVLISFAIAHAMGALITRDAGLAPLGPVPESHIRFVESNRTELQALLAPLMEGDRGGP